MAANSAGKQRGGPGRPFKKGQSGNPVGRPEGSRNKATVALQSLLDEEGEAAKVTTSGKTEEAS
jgi:hypothetical protein